MWWCVTGSRGTCSKAAEGAGEMLGLVLKREFAGSLKAGVGFRPSKGVFRALYKKIDYSEYGGAPMFGLKGGCIVCHGRSKAKAVANAVRITHQYVEEKIHEKIKNRMKESTLLEKFSFDWRT